MANLHQPKLWWQMNAANSDSSGSDLSNPVTGQVTKPAAPIPMPRSISLWNLNETGDPFTSVEKDEFQEDADNREEEDRNYQYTGTFTGHGLPRSNGTLFSRETFEWLATSSTVAVEGKVEAVAGLEKVEVQKSNVGAPRSPGLRRMKGMCPLRVTDGKGNASADVAQRARLEVLGPVPVSCLPLRRVRVLSRDYKAMPSIQEHHETDDEEYKDYLSEITEIELGTVRLVKITRPTTKPKLVIVKPHKKTGPATPKDQKQPIIVAATPQKGPKTMDIHVSHSHSPLGNLEYMLLDLELNGECPLPPSKARVSSFEQRPLEAKDGSPRLRRKPCIKYPVRGPAPPLSKFVDNRSFRYPKHQCLVSGHMFRELRLCRLPDDSTINDVPVWYWNARGEQTFCAVPVYCNLCARDVGNSVWQCEIKACRQEVCYRCCLKQEMEFMDRAVGSHGYN